MDPSQFALFKWPAVVLVLGLAAIVLLRASLAGLLDRLGVNFQKWGVNASIGPQKQEPETSPISQEVLATFEPALIKEQEEGIEKMLADRGAVPGPQRERELLTLVAGAITINLYEGIYYQIYGSQLGALQALNSAPDGFPLESIRPWYDLSATIFPETYTNYSFDEWLAFLEAHILIRRAEGTINITNRGRSFLRFLVHQGHSLTKPN